jgi:hypothetical protein
MGVWIYDIFDVIYVAISKFFYHCLYDTLVRETCLLLTSLYYLPLSLSPFLI